jgi:hypothetical protein
MPQGGTQAWKCQDKKEIRKGDASPLTEKTNKARVEQWLTFDLFLFHLESAAPGLDRQLEALDGLTLLLEGQLLVCVRSSWL